MDNRIKILIAFPFVFVIILFIAASYMPFSGQLTEAGERILAFSPAGLAVKEKPEAPITGDIKSPVDFGVQAPREVTAEGAALVPDKDSHNNDVSLIVVSGKRKMAIIRGVIVREGDSIDGVKVSAIETERVLLKNKTEKWLHMEKTK